MLVTRPAAQAAEWVASLRGHGIDALGLPLIGIAPADDAAALHAAWLSLAQRRLVMFVSPNAAHQFVALRPVAMAWPPGVLAGSPGPGTTHTLVDSGVPAGCIVEPAADAVQFDSEALWAQLEPLAWQGANVLIVRGDGGRDWLADTLRQHGAQVAFLQAYRRVPPTFDGPAAALLRTAVRQPAGHLWLFSSSEAVGHLAAHGDAADWVAARAVATHPRIAERAVQLGFGRVVQARPTLASVVACIQSLRP